MSFHTRVVRMGDTRVIRLPKEILDKTNVADDGDVAVDVEEGRIIIRATYKPPSRAAARKLFDSGGHE